jgi:hypothetical protein
MSSLTLLLGKKLMTRPGVAIEVPHYTPELSRNRGLAQVWPLPQPYF